MTMRYTTDAADNLPNSDNRDTNRLPEYILLINLSNIFLLLQRHSQPLRRTRLLDPQKIRIKSRSITPRHRDNNHTLPLFNIIHPREQIRVLPSIPNNEGDWGAYENNPSGAF
jgi:hypothetical protein